MPLPWAPASIALAGVQSNARIDDFAYWLYKLRYAARGT